ncbi:MAG: GerW family sporulation protein [Lewinellaceae bacterium]|nr:GerW family sporulation protein [Saprospiraceae bacterium]MCB9306407.1 GerW family sporulation protein [Lewinellaceae bacterium]MCB9353656.1 GerW family sporulation protein [Lewinellaceae bacterium]
MKTNFEDVLTRLSDFFKQEANTETVVGKEFKLGEFTCVPVIRLGLGFGYGGGEGEAPQQGKGEGGGAGAGLGIEPMGFLVTRNGEISFVPSKVSHGLSAAFEKVPDLLSQYLEKQKAEKEATTN